MVSQEKFEHMAVRLGHEAREHPLRYRVLTALWLVLGYALVSRPRRVLDAVFVGIALFIAAAAGLGAVVAVVAAMPFLLWIATLWIATRDLPREQNGPPQGVVLTPEAAPPLFAEMESIRKRLGAARIHDVVVTSETELGVRRRSRTGPLGRQRNYLVVGLAQLWALSPEEFRAVLAHEFAHLFRASERKRQWINLFFVRRDRLQRHMKEKGIKPNPIRVRLIEWYEPRLAARIHVLMRIYEMGADREAAAIAGQEAMIAALKQLVVLKHFLGRKYWLEVWTRTSTQPEPPDAVWAEFMERLREPTPPAEAEAWLREALEHETVGLDTHPPLAERLAALNCSAPEELPPWRGASGLSAVEHYLGDGAKTLTRRVEECWREQAAEAWTARHRQWNELTERLAELEANAAQAPLSPDEELERAQVLLQLQGAQAALPILQSLVNDDADPQACLLLGEILVSQEDEGGIKHLTAAMDRDRDYTFAACRVVIEYLERSGRSGEAEPYRNRLQAYVKEVALAGPERKAARLTRMDILLPHDMADTDLAALTGALRGYPAIRRAYLARKQVRHLPEKPLYVLGVVAARGVGVPTATAVVHWVATEVPFPSNAIIVAGGGKYATIMQKLKNMPGSEVYVSASRKYAAAGEQR